MKKTLLSFTIALISTAVFAQNWTLDKSHANVSFTVVHLMISEVDGNFKKFDASIKSDKADFSDAAIEFSADVSSINTGNDMRNEHLQGDGWFDAAKFPSLTFKSTSVKKVSENNYKISGNLTMKGLTKPFSMDALIRGPIDGRGGKKVIGIKATGTVNRADFGVGSSGGSVDNEVAIKVSGEFSK